MNRRLAALLVRWLVAVGAVTFVAVAVHGARSGSEPEGARPPVATCMSLASTPLGNGTVTLAVDVAPGAFVPTNGGASQAYRTLPAFCRVAATLTPTADSDIAVEVWLPASQWNGKFMAVGNGGWSGSINYPALADALRRGYATASTNTGHDGSSASFALGHPEKVIDFAYRSEHEMTVTGKAIVTAFYARGASRAYWNGCSAGGRQGLKEAQRFPDDFDGIVAGAPASHWTGRATQSIWITQAAHKDATSEIPATKFPLIHSAVLAACDARDGVKDGVLEDPTRCDFDAAALTCTDADAATCLTKSQVDTARKIYAGPTNPRTGELIFPGHERGSELGWATMAGPRPFGIGLDHFRFVVFEDPNWLPGAFDFDRDYARTLALDHGTIDALEPNLSAYFGRGGKLLQYHGWSDPQISPGSSVRYYQSVTQAMGGVSAIDSSYRLFMVPGMAHCNGGDGTSTFDVVAALEQWVERGAAPASIPASRLRDGKVDRTRPLCPYPQVATYTGTGSTDEAASFACRAPSR